jgi:hypothetical protein
MDWRQIPQTSPRAVMAREKIKPLTRIHMLQVRVEIHPDTVAYILREAG